MLALSVRGHANPNHSKFAGQRWFRRCRGIRPVDRSRRELAIERLESRSLLASGELDPTFGVGGIVSFASCPTCDIDQVIGVGTQGDGRIVVGGSRVAAGTGADFAAVRFNVDGTLDDGSGNDSTPGDHFGVAGVATIGFTDRDDQARDMQVLPNGKIAIAGTVDRASTLGDVAVALFDADGQRDASFGLDGLAIVDFLAPSGVSTDDQMIAMTVDASGRFVVLARTSLAQFVMARFDANGQLDSTFGDSGKVTTTLTAATDIVSTSTGYVVVGGITGVVGNEDVDVYLTGYDDAGLLDASFGNGGYVQADINGGLPGKANGAVVTLTPTGELLVAGTYTPTGSTFQPSQFAVARFLPNGSLDTSFGATGASFTSLGPTAMASAGAVAVQIDGKIVVSGRNLVISPFTIEFAVARLNADGSLDNGTSSDATPGDQFGELGWVTTPTAANGFELALQADEKILVAGTPLGGGMILARYDNEPPPDGDADDDGVADAVEDAFGDLALLTGNPEVDMAPLSQQPNVAAVPNAVDGGYIVLVAPQGTSLVDVSATDPAVLGVPGPSGVTLPYGLISYSVAAPSGAIVSLDIYLPPAATPSDAFYKFGPTAGYPFDHWYDFTPVDGIGAERVDLNGDGQAEWRLTLKDGGRGDADLTPNGIIVDPAALGNIGRHANIFGTVFHDANGNGQRDPTEPRLPGVRVDLANADTGMAAATTTGADGYYAFDSLPLDVYDVTITPPAGHSGTVQFTPQILTVGTEVAQGLDSQRSVTLGDLDGDSDLDLVAVNFFEVVTLSNLGGRSFDAPVRLGFSVGSRGETAVVGDFDGDLRMDVAVAADQDGTVDVYRDLRDVSTVRRSTYSLGGQPWAIAAATFSGPSMLDDLIVTDPSAGTVTQLLNNSAGGFVVQAPLAVGESARDVGVGDFNGDGDADIAVAIRDGVRVLLGSLGDSLLPFPATSLAGGVRQIAVDRLDDDHLYDVAVTLTDENAVVVLKSNGDGSFSEIDRVPIGGDSPQGITVADLDGDGDGDLATANFQSGDVSVLVNRGDGTFDMLTELTITTDTVNNKPFRVTAGDLDGDGLPDLVVSTLGSPFARILYPQSSLRRRFDLGANSVPTQADSGVRVIDGGSIGGRVFRDDNGDGIDNGEPPAPVQALVYLDLDEDAEHDSLYEPWTVTDAAGNYVLGNLPSREPGNSAPYIVRAVIFEPGYTPTQGPGMPDIAVRQVYLAEGEHLTDQNFGFIAPGTVTGTVFEDFNGDGSPQPTEPRFEGWEVFVDLDGDRERDTGEPTTTTDATGQYSFVLSVGVYDAVQIVPFGWEQHSPDRFGLVVETLQTVTADFANRGINEVRGVVWDDADADRMRGESEPLLAFWTVFADRDNDGIRDPSEPSTLTTPLGSYALHLPPGATTIAVELQPQYELSAPGIIRHIVDPPFSPTVIEDRDFGVRVPQPSDFRGTVWLDENGNGVREPGEPGRVGATLRIGDRIRTTNENGDYIFDHVSSHELATLLLDGEGWVTTVSDAGPKPLAHAIAFIGESRVVRNFNDLVDSYPDQLIVRDTAQVWLSEGPARGFTLASEIPGEGIEEFFYIQSLNIPPAVAAWSRERGEILVYRLDEATGHFTFENSIAYNPHAFLPDPIFPSYDVQVTDIDRDGAVDVIQQNNRHGHLGEGYDREFVFLFGDESTGALPADRSEVVDQIRDARGPFYLPEDPDIISDLHPIDWDGDNVSDLVGVTSRSKRVAAYIRDWTTNRLSGPVFSGAPYGDVLSVIEANSSFTWRRTIVTDRENSTARFLDVRPGIGLVGSEPFTSTATTFSRVNANGDEWFDLVGYGGDDSEAELWVNLGPGSSVPTEARFYNTLGPEDEEFYFVRSGVTDFFTESRLSQLADFNDDGLADFVGESFVFFNDGFSRFLRGRDFGVIMLPDSDGDGLGDLYESFAPRGDGNRDGTKDYLQPNVETFSARNGTPVTLAAPDNVRIVDFQSGPIQGFAPYEVLVFPLESISFSIEEGFPGAFGPDGRVVVELVLPGPLRIDGYYKYGPTPDDASSHWYAFEKTASSDTGAELIDEDGDPATIERIRLHFVDGGRGDSDLAVNGRIVDPGGPALSSIPLFGDLNNDLRVDVLDLGILQSHLGALADVVYQYGDLTGDGAVTATDAAALAREFGRSILLTAASPAAASIVAKSTPRDRRSVADIVLTAVDISGGPERASRRARGGTTRTLLGSPRVVDHVLEVYDSTAATLTVGPIRRIAGEWPSARKKSR